MVWILVVVISFPIATVIAWTLARTNIPFSNTLEVVFWVSFMMPGLATTLSWIMLMDPSIGLFNKLLERLPFVEEGPFNIFSVPGIIWAHLMANGISTKVMLLTPAFRNMDSRLEEQARVGGAGNLQTMMRVTLPLMISPMVLVFSLQLLRILSGFEIEYLLGTPIGFFVYSTLIYELVDANNPPLYGQATVLASLTLLVVALVIPVQRWVSHRRRYTTITGQFKPGLLDLGKFKWVIFGLMAGLLIALTAPPRGDADGGQLHEPHRLLQHRPAVQHEALGLRAGRQLLLGGSPHDADHLYRRRHWKPAPLHDPCVHPWYGRGSQGASIWTSSSGRRRRSRGSSPGLASCSSSWARPVLASCSERYSRSSSSVLLQGNTVGVNISKGVLLQVGAEIEEAARIAGRELDEDVRPHHDSRVDADADTARDDQFRIRCGRHVERGAAGEPRDDDVVARRARLRDGRLPGRGGHCERDHHLVHDCAGVRRTLARLAHERAPLGTLNGRQRAPSEEDRYGRENRDAHR